MNQTKEEPKQEEPHLEKPENPSFIVELNQGQQMVRVRFMCSGTST